MSEYVDESNIPMKTIQEVVVPAREYLALTIKKGQTLRLIDLEG